jgi:hypothetical protein
MKTSLAPATASNQTRTPTPHVMHVPTTSDYAMNDSRWGRQPRTLRNAIAHAVRSVRSLGPYLAIELILPGGSLIALALWTYRHRRAARERAQPASPAVVPPASRAPLRCATPCAQR